MRYLLIRRLSRRQVTSVSFQGLMLQDLVSAKLISDYIIIEIPESINDLQGTNKVRFHYF